MAILAGIDSVTIAYSLNNGSTWTVIATGESNDGTYAWTLPMGSSDSVLVRVAAYDTTGNSGSDVSDAVFRITSSTGVGDPIMPVALTLSPAHPNPLTGAGTAISFGLTREGSVSLNVFDATGRRVAALAGGSYPEGFHTVVWNGRREDGSRAPARRAGCCPCHLVAVPCAVAAGGGGRLRLPGYPPGCAGSCARAGR